MSHFWIGLPTDFKHLVFSKDIFPYSQEHVTGLVYYQRAKNSSFSNSLKLPFFRKNTPQVYFGETGDFNLFVRPIPKYNLLRQSFTNTITQR